MRGTIGNELVDELFTSGNVLDIFITIDKK